MNTQIKKGYKTYGTLNIEKDFSFLTDIVTENNVQILQAKYDIVESVTDQISEALPGKTIRIDSVSYQTLTTSKDIAYLFVGNQNEFITLVSKITSSDIQNVHLTFIPISFFTDIWVLSQFLTSESLLCNKINLDIYLNMNILSMVSELSFLQDISELFRIAVLGDLSLYSLILSNIYELKDRDLDTISSMLESIYIHSPKIMKKSLENDISNPFSFAESSLDAFQKSEFTKDRAGDSRSLAILTLLYISVQKGLLDSDEFYEIRDMMVAFGLSISYSEPTPQEVLQNFTFDSNNSITCCLPLKVGKLTMASISPEEILAALEELYYDEKAND